MTSLTSSTAGNILAIDTSGLRGSLALASGSRRFKVEWEKRAMHSELATVKLQELLAAADIPLNSIAKILVNAGPGSFTGIRVGINLARTLAYSLAIPIASLTSLQLLAYANHKPDKNIFIAIKAIQTFYYAAGFRAAGPSGLAESLAPASIREADLATMSRQFDQVLVEGQSPGFTSQLEASFMLDLLAQRPDSITFSTWKEVRPVYIRASEAEEKLLKGLLKA